MENIKSQFSSAISQMFRKGKNLGNQTSEGWSEATANRLVQASVGKKPTELQDKGLATRIRFAQTQDAGRYPPPPPIKYPNQESS